MLCFMLCISSLHGLKLPCYFSPCCTTGPAPCMLLSSVLENGKTQSNGRKGYAGCIRHRMALLCGHGALARHMATRYNVDQVTFPDPRDRAAWLSEALWPAWDRTQNIQYQQMASNLRTVLDEEEIFIKKLTHAFRVYGARLMDEAGCDDKVGGWWWSCIIATLVG